MLIATLPSIDNSEAIEQMANHPFVDGVRYNVGARSPFSPMETLERLQQEIGNKKVLWIDLKGRQLRITAWADPSYGDIVLNHTLWAKTPARIVFRGGEVSFVRYINGNRIYISPYPEHALGAGQAVNILGESLEVKGYLTEQDIEYIKAAKELGINNLMLSFVERKEDLEEVVSLNPDAQMVLKIENQRGLNFIQNFDHQYRDHDDWWNCRLMLARDDLMINLSGNQARILEATKLILDKDPGAIAASHIFGSLEHGSLSAADFSDLMWLWQLGYREFLLDDIVSLRVFEPAMKAWTDFLAVAMKPS